MESEKRKCRLCGLITKDCTHNIFSVTQNGQQILQLMKQYLPILIYRTDPLPKEICDSCYKNLINYDLFYNTSMKVYDSFKAELFTKANDPQVKLYLDSLENQSEYFGESSKFSAFLQKYIKTKTSTKCTNTLSEIKVETNTDIVTTNLTILTPSRINQINDIANNDMQSDSILATLLSDEERPRKKRRLVGPKSKIKKLGTELIYNPPTLLQVALKQINANLNMTTETNENMSTETESSRSSSPDMSLIEPARDIGIINDHYEMSYDPNEAVICNYCMKKFNNIVMLALHEIQHIKVVVGPKVDSKEFFIRRRRYIGLYQDYLQRQKAGVKEVKETVKKTKDTPVRCTRPKSIAAPKKEIAKPVKVVKDNLVIPGTSSMHNHNFEIINNEITVNGAPLRNMDKSERRRFYKDIIISGVKRKYCPLCRYTFKDNWSIEYHYFNDVCQYTCKHCGKKFKFQKDIFKEHIKVHAGETANRIFGPRETKFTFKKKKKLTASGKMYKVPSATVIPPKVKPLKMKHLLQKKFASTVPVKIKTEPDLPPMDDSVTLEATGGNNMQPYQAFFCRKCFAVFYKLDQYNIHIQSCNGETSKSTETPNNPTTKSFTIHVSSSPAAPASYNNDSQLMSNNQDAILSRRNLRSSNRESTSVSADSDTEIPAKASKGKEEVGLGFECGVCCSSFPSLQSRNSHMRIHKGNISKTVLNKVSAKSHAIIRSEQQNVASNFISNMQNDIRLTNLDPTVARLVQNNPNLTIRSYSKAQMEKAAEIAQQSSQNHATESMSDLALKRVYRCADCNGKFENKSVLYYHKMNSCIIKKHYECAFCRKKFGTYDQYNTHMFYVHPE